MDCEATRRELSCWLERPSNYIIFAELFAFQNGEIEDVGMTYEWFQKSDCQIVIVRLRFSSIVNRRWIQELSIQTQCSIDIRMSSGSRMTIIQGQVWQYGSKNC